MIIMKKHVSELSEIYNLLDQDQNAIAFNVSSSDTSHDLVNAAHSTYPNAKKIRPICSHCGY